MVVLRCCGLLSGYAAARLRASRMIGARGSNRFIARVIAYTFSLTGNSTPGGHGKPYALRAHEGRIAIVAVTTTAHSGRNRTGIGGFRITFIPSRAAGVATSPVIDARYSRISPYDCGTIDAGSSTCSATRPISRV